MNYQNGSLRKITRKSGEQVWEFRYRDASRTMRQKTLRCSEFPSVASVKVELQSIVFSLNVPAAMTKTTPFGMVVERFIVEERLREIAAQRPGLVTEVGGMAYATAVGYLTSFKCHILPRWGSVSIEDIRPMDVLKWLKEIDLSGMSKGRTKAHMHMLFEKAMLWEVLAIQRNPVDLVKLKGVTVRKKKKMILTADQFQQLREVLPEPYKAMATLAICTGLRISEILALRWEHINSGSLLVQAAAVNGRIGKVKTQSSSDQIPLHPSILAELPVKSEGLIFPCQSGGAFHGGYLQQAFLRPAGLKLWGVDNLGWHSLRHSCRTLLDECGTPMGVQQKLMRHANISTTMNVYGNSTMIAKREAQSKVVDMIVGLVGLQAPQDLVIQ